MSTKMPAYTEDHRCQSHCWQKELMHAGIDVDTVNSRDKTKQKARACLAQCRLLVTSFKTHVPSMHKSTR